MDAPTKPEYFANDNPNDDIIWTYTMELAMQVAKWGTSLAVRLPKALVGKMGLRAGDELSIVDVAERTLVVQKEDRRKAALDRLASSSGLQIRSGRGERAVSAFFDSSILVYTPDGAGPLPQCGQGARRGADLSVCAGRTGRLICPTRLGK